MTGNTVLIDCDIIAVACSASSEKRQYEYKGEQYDTKTALKEAHPNYNPEDVDLIIQPAPFSHARHSARLMVDAILAANAPVKEYRGYVTGPGNFRFNIAKTQPYKGNRKDMIQPVWRREVEEFLIAECNCERVEGYEADDKLAVEFLKDPQHSVLCSLDKDFKQVPGLRMYSWRTKEIETVSPVEALRNFYKQTLVGDTVDHILGVTGIGPARAEKIVGNVADEKLLTTLCYTEYLKAYGKEAWMRFEESCRLLYLCRTEEDLKSPEKAWKPKIYPQG